MTYPQPRSNDYAINGYKYFRLNTLLSSPGDIYESEQSGHGFAVGPESDLANIVVQYFDQQAPDNLQQTIISPRRAFVGRIDARNDATYAPSQTKARILLWTADIYDPNFKPHSFVANDEMAFVVPQLDVIEYFEPQASLGPDRIDKDYLFQNYNAIGTTFIVIPFYGRKYCYSQFTNRNATTPATFGIIGVNYAITDDSSTTPYHQETVILTPTVINSGISHTTVVTAAVNGSFDALVFSVLGGNPSPLRIITSDNST